MKTLIIINLQQNKEKKTLDHTKNTLYPKMKNLDMPSTSHRSKNKGPQRHLLLGFHLHLVGKSLLLMPAQKKKGENGKGGSSRIIIQSKNGEKLGNILFFATKKKHYGTVDTSTQYCLFEFQKNLFHSN